MDNRELDCLMAEHVEGWQRWTWAGMDEGTALLMPPDWEWVSQRWHIAPSARVVNADEDWIPPYSSDIAAAWPILKHVEAAGFTARMRFAEHLQRIVTKRAAPGLIGLIDHSALLWFLEPEDICRAALAALGVDHAALAADQP